MEAVDDESEKKILGGTVDTHLGSTISLQLASIDIYLRRARLFIGLITTAPELISHYTSVNQTPAATSARRGLNGVHFGNSQFNDGSYENEYDMICAVHSASTGTMCSQLGDTVNCTVLSLGHKTYFNGSIVESYGLMRPKMNSAMRLWVPANLMTWKPRMSLVTRLSVPASPG